MKHVFIGSKGKLPPPTLSSQTHPQSPSHSVKRPSSPDHPRQQKRIICFIQRQSQIPLHNNSAGKRAMPNAQADARAESSSYSETSPRNKSPRERYSSTVPTRLPHLSQDQTEALICAQAKCTCRKAEPLQSAQTLQKIPRHYSNKDQQITRKGQHALTTNKGRDKTITQRCRPWSSNSCYPTEVSTQSASQKLYL